MMKLPLILEGKEEKFEELKPVIAYVAKNLCKIDMILHNIHTERVTDE